VGNIHTTCKEAGASIFISFGFTENNRSAAEILAAAANLLVKVSAA
jgi:hypothetical protein